jgi:REP element-mobilizing transposase RayT
MRNARIKPQGDAIYHVISRVVDRKHIFGAREKERFRETMRKLEAFCGLRILTHSILSNHFHLLIHVPERREVTDEELVERVGALYQPSLANRIARRLKDLRAKGQNERAEEIKAGYAYRMYDITEYMKSLKQRFTQYYNRKVGRKGTLWEERFKSLLLEDSEHLLSVVAGYIDVNAVRAGLVKDPKDYRFCGYGEAMGGSQRAREGLAWVMSGTGDPRSWSEVAPAYRKLLYVQGEQRGVDEQGRPLKKGFSREEVQAVLDAGGRLPIAQILRCRVRYFSDGLVLGSREFVEEVFQKHRDQFGFKRETGACPMRHAQWNGLCTMRELRCEVVTA